MAIYCWGNTAHGELGLGGIEEEQIFTPRKMPWAPEAEVRQIACGASHTLFLLADGKVYSCGSNDDGQLGHELPTKRPQWVSELKNYVIVSISSGQNHSLALSEWGQLFSWGSNEYGQLGHPQVRDTVRIPRIIKQLVSKTVIQISCGRNHCLALTSCGEIYVWGLNQYGQLGMATKGNGNGNGNKLLVPTYLNSLSGIPIALIACGGNHSFVVSKSGAVFGWGRNNCGQLGLNDNNNRIFPTQLKTLRSLGVRFIACGEEFSAFLTSDGGVFTCGSGGFGQLGHGSNANEVLPRKVTELMGTTITQLACGTRHTLALVPSRGRVYSFGLGSAGQLGARISLNSAAVPQVVLGPWVSPSGSALFNTSDEQELITIKQIFSGGEHCLVTTAFFKQKVPALDYRIYDAKTQILCLSVQSSKECAAIGKNDTIDMDLLSSIELIFTSLACINASFLLANDKHICCTSRHHGVDESAAAEAFEYLRKIENESLKNVILDKVSNELINRLSSSPCDVETLRVYLILPYYHEFDNSKNYERLHTRFSTAVTDLTTIPKKIVSRWWSEASSEYFEHLVLNYKNVVSHIIAFKLASGAPIARTDSEGLERRVRLIKYNSHLVAALNMLVLLHHINHNERRDKLHYEIFYWPELTDHVDIQQEYIAWLFEKNNEAFNICNYPFLFNASAKTTLLQTDQAIQMHNAMQNAATSNIFSLLTFGTAISQFIVLNVSRQNLVQDTLKQIMQCNQNDLKKPLKVKFHEEEAEDAGGVRKEFFMLLLKDLIDPKYGMFKEFEDSRFLWFADITFETDDMYFLIGVICGLAIYNFTIINLPFPLALYKKLLNEPVDLKDLSDLSPMLGRSMQQLLDYEGDDFVAVFDLYFVITRNIFGETKEEPLKPGGEEVHVTQENKNEFVDLYVDYIFNKAVSTQFRAFQKGFMKVCWGRVLSIFKAQELMAMVVGNEEYDWKALELNADYKNGYTPGDQTIRWFWEVFHELTEEDKKKFLLYLTGSDRIPIQGMKAIQIIIQPTSDERFLPVAHTCFNLLDLPRYKTKERLKYKLLQAIQQTQGFSLV